MLKVKTKNSPALVFNLTGLLVLFEYFFGKYFPDENTYEKKKAWKPLLISVLIIIPFLLALIYGGDPE